MRAVTFQGPKDIRVVEKDVPEILGPADAILRVTTSAICGTDLHIYHEKFPAVAPGTTLGHEFAGVIEQVGDGVRDLEVGRRYVASMFPACGTCPACIRGDWRNCGHFGLFGCGDAFGSLEGGQAEFVRVPFADMTLTPIPDRLTDEDVIFVGDILSTPFTALTLARLRPGQSVAVVGAGPVGQLAVMCASLFGAAPLFAIDLVPARLKEAKALGAIPINLSETDPFEAIGDYGVLNGVDLVLEAAGTAESVETAYSVARVGATIAIVGALMDEPWPLSCGDNWLRAITVMPVLGNPLTHRYDLMRLIEAGRLTPASIISHTMGLDDATEAYRMFDHKEATKIVLKP